MTTICSAGNPRSDTHPCFWCEAPAGTPCRRPAKEPLNIRPSRGPCTICVDDPNRCTPATCPDTMNDRPQTLAEKHDPAGRLMPGEPAILFPARDILAPGTGTIWAEVKAGRYPQARAALEALIQTRESQPFHPIKDPEHATAMKQRANELRCWRAANFKTLTHNGRVNTAPDRDEPVVMIGIDPASADGNDAAVMVEGHRAAGGEIVIDKITTLERYDPVTQGERRADERRKMNDPLFNSDHKWGAEKREGIRNERRQLAKNDAGALATVRKIAEIKNARPPAEPEDAQ